MAKAATKSGYKSTSRGGVKGGGGGGIHPLYAAPIKECAATGNLREMKSMAAKARKHIADVQKALASLEQSISKLGG
jgi:hypothetical protein